MSRANRVQPDGGFATLPRHGAFMGNRGCLHDAQGVIRRGHAGKAWITCTLHERADWGPHPFPVPGQWTPLFFLDEAVACAAGHRPCALCRRAVYNEFCSSWERAFGTSRKAVEMDAALHAARIDPVTRKQRRTLRPARDLPTGAFFLWQDRPHLIRDGLALPYADGSYLAPVVPPAGEVTVLTPAPLVDVMAAGWRPALSAGEDRPNW